MATKRTRANKAAPAKRAAAKITARREPSTQTTARETKSVFWFDGVLSGEDSSDPWFVIRFHEAVSEARRSKLIRLLPSELRECGVRTWSGRELELDYTGVFDRDVDAYAGGHRQFVRDLRAGVKAMHELQPICVVFSKPDEAKRAIDDDTVSAYRRSPVEAALRMANGSAAERLMAAKSAHLLLGEHRAVAEGLLSDPAPEVASTAKASVGNHFTYWSFRKSEPYERSLELFRRGGSPAVADAARTIEAAIVRDYVREADTTTRALVDAMSDPLAGPYLRALVDGWDALTPAWWEHTIPSAATAAIWVARVREDWPKVEALALRALDLASGMKRLPSAEKDHEEEVAKVEALLDRALAEQGKPPRERPPPAIGAATPLASCEPGSTVTVVARVVSLAEPRAVARKGGDLAVRDGVLEDESGQLGLTLWGDECDAVNEGDLIRVDEGWVKRHWVTQKPVLSLGRSGRLTVLEPPATARRPS